MNFQNRDHRPLNKFRAPRKTWGSWTLVGRHTFNKLYETMMKNPEAFQKRGEKEISEEAWRVTSRNAATMAASIVSRGERHLLKDLTERIKP